MLGENEVNAVKKVAIIGPVDKVGKKVIRETLGDCFNVIDISNESEYDTKLADVDYAVLRTLTLRENAIKKAFKLKFIQRWGAGYDTVDIKCAGKRQIPVGVLAGVNATPVAEYAVLLMLAVMRHIIKIHQNVISGKGRDETLLASAYIMKGKKVGLVGMGSIGKEVAQKVQAFGAEVIYYDVLQLSEEIEKKLNVTYMPLDELVAKTDIISIHVPLLDSTKHLFDKKLLSKMKKHAVLINTSRGGIIDENALYDALKSHNILGAGIDVFEHEPIKENNPLVTLDNIVMSAHCAGNTIDNSVIMGRYCAENILKIDKGEKLTRPDLVNEQYLE